MNEGFGEIGARAELGFFYGVRHAHELALPGGRLDVVRHVVGENDDARRVALLVGEICERNRQVAAVIELGDVVRGVAHGRAAVEQERELAVGLAAVALQIHALSACEHVPIDVPQIVAGRVGAVLGEFLAEAEVGGFVQARHETVDHRFGDKVQVRETG